MTEPVSARWRDLPRFVWAATACWTMLLVVWSLVLPSFRSADETVHLSGVLRIEYHHDWPGFKGLPMDAGAQGAASSGGFVTAPPAEYPPLHADDATPLADRPSFAELGAGTEGKGLATIGQHPPGYYGLLAGVSTIIPNSTSATFEAWVLRLVSVVLLAPLPAVLARATRVLGGTRAAVCIVAALPFTVPQLAATGGAVNNDNLVNAAAAWVTLGVATVLAGDLRWRVAAGTGVALGVALLSKAFALVLLPFVAGAYLLVALRSRRRREALIAAVVSIGTSFVGGWWWVYSYLRYGQVQPSGHIPPRPEGRIGWQDSIGDFTGHFFDLVPGRFWATLSIKGPLEPGGPDVTAFPWWSTALLSVLLLGALMVAVVLRRVGPIRRSEVVLLLFPFVSLLAILFVQTWNIFDRTGMARGLQGRYAFAGLPGVFIVLALLIAAATRNRPPAVAPTAVTVGGLGFTALALERTVRFHYGIDATSLAGAPRALVEWSPVPTVIDVAVGLAFAVTVALIATQLVAEWRHPTPET